MSSGAWATALIIFVAAALANEATPLFVGTGMQAQGDWSLLYVSMKFVALPAVSLLIFVLVGVHAWRKRTLPIWAAVTGAVAVLYLATLVAWPLPWFV